MQARGACAKRWIAVMAGLLLCLEPCASMGSTLKAGPVVSAITPNGVCSLQSVDRIGLMKCAMDAAKHGAAIVQIRDQGARAEDIAALGAEIKCSCSAVGAEARVLLNLGASTFLDGEGALREDAAATAARYLRTSGCDGLHVPEAAVAAGALGALRAGAAGLGDEMLIGCAAHSVGAATRAVEEGAGYVQVGTMFATASHPGKVPEGVALMREVRDALGDDAVLIGVGGIGPSNAGEVTGAGATGVAVISSVFGKGVDVRENVEALHAAMG